MTELSEKIYTITLQRPDRSQVTVSIKACTTSDAVAAALATESTETVVLNVK